MGWYFEPTPKIEAALEEGKIPPIVESRLLKVIESFQKAKKEGEAVWNALLDCPKTETVHQTRVELRKGLTDIQTQLSDVQTKLALKCDDEGEPLQQAGLEGDFMKAATSLQTLLGLVEVANSYVQLNRADGPLVN